MKNCKSKPVNFFSNASDASLNTKRQRRVFLTNSSHRSACWREYIKNNKSQQIFWMTQLDCAFQYLIELIHRKCVHFSKLNLSSSRAYFLMKFWNSKKKIGPRPCRPPENVKWLHNFLYYILWHPTAAFNNLVVIYVLRFHSSRNASSNVKTKKVSWLRLQKIWTCFEKRYQKRFNIMKISLKINSSGLIS